MIKLYYCKARTASINNIDTMMDENEFLRISEDSGEEHHTDGNTDDLQNLHNVQWLNDKVSVIIDLLIMVV